MSHILWQREGQEATPPRLCQVDENGPAGPGWSEDRGREASQDWAALKGREGTQAQTSRSASVSEEAADRAKQPSVMKAACNTQAAGRQFPTLVYWENKKPKPS